MVEMTTAVMTGEDTTEGDITETEEVTEGTETEEEVEAVVKTSDITEGGETQTMRESNYEPHHQVNYLSVIYHRSVFHTPILNIILHVCHKTGPGRLHLEATPVPRLIYID